VASSSDEPIDSERAERMGFLTSNPMYRDLLGRTR
jgi:hypothetical protein